jgi:hypothetical protein
MLSNKLERDWVESSWSIKFHPRRCIEMLAPTDLVVTQMGKPSEPLAPQDEVLRRAVIKVVASGKRAGVNAAEMIELLKSGISVGELLEYLAARTVKSRTA